MTESRVRAVTPKTWLRGRIGRIACCLCLTAGGVLGSAHPAAADSYTIPVRFDDTHPRATRFGKLEFLGGLDWRAGRGDFGGFSGLLLDGDVITALTDKAHWAKARLTFTDGRLSGIEGLEIGRLHGSDGQYLQRPYMDSEAIVREGGGYLISFEGQHRVSRFAGLTAPEQRFSGLPDLSDLGTNQGIEAMLSLPDGRLVIVAEEPPGRQGNHIGWIVGGKRPQRFAIERRGRFSVTDMTLSPDGKTVYLLERRYSLLGGPGMHIRRFPLGDIAARATIKGETLIDLGAGYAVDNMEAIAARAGPSGSDELFVLSDDNFSARQRTLLLHFSVVE